MGYKPDYDFKLDLPKGEEAEQKIASLLHMNDGGLVEVKRDFLVSNTGNVAIEYECRGKPSGIAKTKAKWWAIMMDGELYNGEIIVLISVVRLKNIAREYLGTKQDVWGGDDGKARMVLVPIERLVSPCPNPA